MISEFWVFPVQNLLLFHRTMNWFWIWSLIIRNPVKINSRRSFVSWSFWYWVASLFHIESICCCIWITRPICPILLFYVPFESLDPQWLIDILFCQFVEIFFNFRIFCPDILKLLYSCVAITAIEILFNRNNGLENINYIQILTNGLWVVLQISQGTEVSLVTFWEYLNEKWIGWSKFTYLSENEYGSFIAKNKRENSST